MYASHVHTLVIPEAESLVVVAGSVPGRFRPGSADGQGDGETALTVPGGLGREQFAA